MSLAQKNFVVTGAGSGLGAAVSARLVAQGGNVAMLDIDGEAAIKASEQMGTNARAFNADVTSEDEIKSTLSKILNHFERIDGLVNCAGVAPSQRIVRNDSAHDLALFAKTIGVNLIGTFNTMRLVAETMSKQDPDTRGERGVIINTASIAAYEGQIGQTAYAASKGGIASMTLPAARELARHAIRVVTIAPGIFATPMMNAMPEDVQDALGASVPYPPRMGDPDEFARLVTHVFENQMLNGEVIRLDGALRMAAS